MTKPLFIRVFKAGVKDTQNPYDEECSIAIESIEKIKVLDDGVSVIIWADGRQWGPVNKVGFMNWYNGIVI